MKFRLGVQSYPTVDSLARERKECLVGQTFSKILQVLKLRVFVRIESSFLPHVFIPAFHSIQPKPPRVSEYHQCWRYVLLQIKILLQIQEYMRWTAGTYIQIYVYIIMMTYNHERRLQRHVQEDVIKGQSIGTFKGIIFNLIWFEGISPQITSYFFKKPKTIKKELRRVR